MKKIAVIIAMAIAPFYMNAQSPFASFEDDEEVSSVYVSKNLFKLIANFDVSSDDPEVKEMMELINDLDKVEAYSTSNPASAAKMNSAVAAYVNSNTKLSELMRVKDDGKNVKFYAKEGRNENIVSELLMHLKGNVDGKEMSIVMSITGNVDLKKISKITEKLDIPGNKELKKLEKKK